ncbi:MAG: hypothetical protein Q8O67_22085 [Deltaproteobacteria bacterium]|nr:hypothetical protein [Deltaproteobacteria bacterium]
MSKHITSPTSPAAALSMHALDAAPSSSRERLVFGHVRVVVAVVVGLLGVCQAVHSHQTDTPWASLHCRDAGSAEVCHVLRTGPVAPPVVGREHALKWARVETRERKDDEGKFTRWQVVVVSFEGAGDIELAARSPVAVADDLRAMTKGAHRNDVVLRMPGSRDVSGVLVALVAFAVASLRERVTRTDGVVSFETTCCGVPFRCVDVDVAALRGLRFEPGQAGEDGDPARTWAVTTGVSKSLWLSEGQAREAARFLGVGFERLA